MHTLVEMLQLTWTEFDRNLAGLSDEDARKRIEPMNCISWIIAHVANQVYAFCAAWPYGREVAPRYSPYGFGKPASQPPLEEALGLWRDAREAAAEWLEQATEQSMLESPAGRSPESENMGTLLTRCIFHIWCHIGEISSIRQILGHKPPQFVDMHDWMYPGSGNE
jgi:hypothetical protein